MVLRLHFGIYIAVIEVTSDNLAKQLLRFNQNIPLHLFWYIITAVTWTHICTHLHFSHSGRIPHYSINYSIIHYLLVLFSLRSNWRAQYTTRIATEGNCRYRLSLTFTYTDIPNSEKNGNHLTSPSYTSRLQSYHLIDNIM